MYPFPDRRVLLGLGAAFLIVGPASAEKPLRVGTTAGPVGQILAFAADIARKGGQSVEIVEFTDWVTPNEAVADGDLDANLFQHVPFLQAAIKARGYRLVPVEGAFVLPVGLFSKKVTQIDAVPEGARVAIANDPVNAARGLRLLQTAGLLKLTPGAGDDASVADIVENPKRLRILELDAAQLPRALDDVALAQVSFTYLFAAGGNPRTALISDGQGDRHYTLSFVSRPENRDDPRLKAFIVAVRSPEVKAYVEKTFSGFLEPVW
ncbi:MetQ/NlpA family ABC transporter substrate-binding protein [Methylobacterium pseudosasicola]|uniref:D-methionine transport system substrate-binding protein n=1 Tax=Methylobacterium pseudosasicola TaxID=582667 RepID=A0A1I4MEV2_9HYPH|nr:MetQ/NlpA family ABC transporter substrate-binding protein [Methylobacterium pseudosasicola]SFM01962.1 D-methionine transport system substrate-binding protein [Methylobacterium pseudosasicola]